MVKDIYIYREKRKDRGEERERERERKTTFMTQSKNYQDIHRREKTSKRRGVGEKVVLLDRR